ncbi:ran guanine nucleotide release factor-like [Saccoglossus kowalevskii]|uniref:Ran guanine nucleotide release factor-like n=1 Tax=Saccoglossus kowalevskii TaxID=10224 RepID=A0ABM0MHM4_SACKO|nr:PREDICTED: ran guanine nucleotide release factor-like [Saccoglossus kowalevskii]
MSGSIDRQLFGGALTVVLLNGAVDISELREIPDNQEVFAHPSTDQSMIIEILEYQQIEDKNAVSFHFHDIAESNDSSCSEVQITEEIPLQQISVKDCCSAWLLSGKQCIAKFNEQAKNTVNVHMALFRLPQFSTDILMSFNDPEYISASSSSHIPAEEYNKSQPWTLQQFKQSITTLKVLDTSIFG